jgi:hypothetical protein
MSYSEESHILVSALKDLALELGRTPLKKEFNDRLRNADRRVIASFGSYTALVQASGLEVSKHNTKKIDNTIFERDIESHLEKYEPREDKTKSPYPTIASISDIHFPFENQRVLDAFYRFIEKHQPEYVICNGDSVDNYSHTRFPRSHNVFTPREEQALARKKLEELWAEIKKACPQSKYLLMLGNHCARPLKQVLDNYPEAEDWIREALMKQFTFEGVQTVMDPREEYMIGDIMIHHGYRTGLGAHRDYTLYNAIIGHTHLGGVTFKRLRGQTLWELNSGYAGDPEAKGLTYTSQKITHWTPGFGMVHEDGPRFIPV